MLKLSLIFSFSNPIIITKHAQEGEDERNGDKFMGNNMATTNLNYHTVQHLACFGTFVLG